MPHAIINNTHLTFSADTKVITQDMVKAYRDIVTSVTFPSDLTTIEEEAFAGCTGLTSVTFPNSLTTIADSAFHGCTRLTSVTFPDSLTTIADSAFHGCTRLTSVTLPNSLTSISSNVFTGCTELTHLTFPDGLSTIRYEAFAGCTGLTSVIFPDSLTTIGWRTFEGCTGLTHLTFPDGLTTISYRAFIGCTGLTSITFPNNLTNIENYAFAGCRGLTHLTFPDSLTSIGTRAFHRCTNLKCLIVPPSLADKDAVYWLERGIDTHETDIVTQQKLHDFQKSHGIEKNTSAREIKTLYLAQHGFIPLPKVRADLSAKIFSEITQLTMANLLKLPININLMLPTLAQYQDITEPLTIFQKAVAPLNKLAADAAQNLAQWLTWQDIAQIWLVKANTPKAATAAEISTQENHSASACQQDDIATPADTPTQPTQLPHSVITKSTRGSQNNLPTPQHPRGH